MLAKTECNPKRIVQIVSGSRSGSSLLKKVLSQSPDVIALAGEEEPYTKMSGNGYGMTSDSDAFTKLVNPRLFRRLLQTELTTEQSWVWRLMLQYRGQLLAKLLNEIDGLVAENPFTWLRKMGVAGYYDGCSPSERLPFSIDVAYEMPPFVIPRSNGDLYREDKVLLLKCPHNVHRPRMIESLFPGAQIVKVLLLRNPAATINGLIDAWRANYGFHKHLTPHGWWKFELPPGWQEFVGRTTAEKCWFQWSSSHHAILSQEENRGSLRVRFEDLVSNPAGVIHRICRYADIRPPKATELPVVMATDKPRPYRWKQKESIILPLVEWSLPLVKELGYGDKEQWL